MRIIATILVISFFLVTSCNKEEIPTFQTDSNGVVISMPYQWKKSLYGGGQSITNSYFDYPILYNGNIGIPTIAGGKRYLTFINPENGKTIWEWDDRYQPETEDINISYYHQYNNLLAYQVGDRSYCINLDNGTTHWKIRRDKSYDGRVNPYQNQFYFTYASIKNKDDNKEQIAYKCDITTGELTEFLRANLSSDYVSPDGVGAIIYVNIVPNNENLLLVTYAEPLPNWEVNSYFGLYNTETEEWVWDRKLLSSPNQNTSVFTPPQIYNEKIYANVGYSIVCHDLSLGNQLWKKDFLADFMFSGFIIADDKIIANNEDTYTYCLSTYNGHTIWKEASAGTSGRMSYLNGIVYFVGGSTGKLHAIDISTGKTVWKLDGQKLDGADFKTNAVYVFEADGNNPAKVIALTHQNAYSFKAYK